MLVELRLVKPWNSVWEYGKYIVFCYIEPVIKGESKGI